MSRTEKFRVLIAVHRPRYRGRSERAAAVPAWEVTSLLNKQDAVGQVQKGNNPPDIVILSSDFGRQKSFGIFKAIQAYRQKGMKLVGLIEPDAPNDVNPADLCDICITTPFKSTDLHTVLARLYMETTGAQISPPDAGEGAED